MSQKLFSLSVTRQFKNY